MHNSDVLQSSQTFDVQFDALHKETDLKLREHTLRQNKKQTALPSQGSPSLSNKRLSSRNVRTLSLCSQAEKRKRNEGSVNQTQSIQTIKSSKKQSKAATRKTSQNKPQDFQIVGVKCRDSQSNEPASKNRRNSNESHN